MQVSSTIRKLAGGSRSSTICTKNPRITPSYLVTFARMIRNNSKRVKRHLNSLSFRRLENFIRYDAEREVQLLPIFIWGTQAKIFAKWFQGGVE